MTVTGLTNDQLPQILGVLAKPGRGDIVRVDADNTLFVPEPLPEIVAYIRGLAVNGVEMTTTPKTAADLADEAMPRYRVSGKRLQARLMTDLHWLVFSMQAVGEMGNISFNSDCSEAVIALSPASVTALAAAGFELNEPHCPSVGVGMNQVQTPLAGCRSPLTPGFLM